MVKITGFEDYSIDVYGNIYSNFKKDFLVPKIDKDGYHYVCLYKKGKEKSRGDAEISYFKQSSGDNRPRYF